MRRPNLHARILLSTLTIMGEAGKDETTMRVTVLCLACFLSGYLLLGSCDSSLQIKRIVRNDLFSIGYGLSEDQIDLSSMGDNSIDMDMKEGIFHILDGSGKKAMRFSSYGDLLALYYDKSRLPEPRTVKPTVQADNGLLGTPTLSQGRYAVAVNFVSPSRMTVDSAQIIYIADRVENPAARVFDVQSQAFCDRIVRRFGAQGMEMRYLGQEGPGGTPFPFITALKALDDDTLAVISESESVFLIHHFGKEGNLLSTLKLNRSSLPLPKNLVSGANDSKNQQIHANLDGIIESIEAKSFRVSLKIDYYREYFDPVSHVISRSEFAGSWIFVLDGFTGTVLRNFNILPSGSDSPIPEFIGMSSGIYYFLSNSEDVHEGTSSGKGPRRILQLIDGVGKVRSRFLIDLPASTKEIVSIKVSPTGYVYALLSTELAVRVVWWYYR